MNVRRAYNNVLNDLLFNYVPCYNCHKLLNYEKGEAYICMSCTSQVLCHPCYYPTKQHEWDMYKLPRRCKKCSIEYLRKII